MEIWEDIEGYEGLYKVNSSGTVKSFHRNKEIIKKLAKDKDGYMTVCLRKNGINRYLKISRLVAKAFTPNPCNYPQVNHLNGIKTDNRVENLEWCTCSQNHKHAFAIGLRSHKGEKNVSSKLTEIEVREIYSLRLFGWEIKLIAKKYNVTPRHIRKICNKKRWKHIWTGENV